MRRVIHNMRIRDNRNASMELLPEEIKDAEEEIVHLAQREAFRDEYAALSSGKSIPKKSQLIKLSPCIDDDGVIRSDGLLKFADFLPYDTRFPIILPRGHLVANYHERGNHAAGANFILCQLSERFWISPHARRFVSGITNVMSVREDEASQLVRLWRHSRKRGSVSASDPSLKQP